VSLLAAPRRLDLTLLLPVLGLARLGLVMIFSARLVLRGDRYALADLLLERQAVRLLAALALICCSRPPSTITCTPGLAPWLLAGASCSWPCSRGRRRGSGANRWLQFASVTVQPTELARARASSTWRGSSDGRGARHVVPRRRPAPRSSSRILARG